MTVNNKTSWGSATLILLFLLGCQSEGVFDAHSNDSNDSNDSNEGLFPPPEPDFIEPEITRLELTYSNGVLTPIVECTTCVDDSYQYSWQINGAEVGSENTFTYEDEHIGYDKIRIEVTGIDTANQTTKAYSDYKVSVLYDASATEALKTDGSMVTWFNYGKDACTPFDCEIIIGGLLSNNVNAMYTNDLGRAVAAKKIDGSMVAWEMYGSRPGLTHDKADEVASGVKTITLPSQERQFAVLKEDGSVVTLQVEPGYYDGDFISVEDELSSGVKAVYSNSSAFAALKEDGSVVTWGDDSFGGRPSYHSPLMDEYVSVKNELSSGIKAVYSSSRAFAALKEDGSVVTWGGCDYYSGWNGYKDPNTNKYVSVKDELSSGVKAIYSSPNGSAFAALKDDGSVVTWGYGYSGWHGYKDPDTGSYVSVKNELSSGVKKVYANAYGFAAVKSDGSIVLWGTNQASAYTEPMEAFKTIISNRHGFAALQINGAVVMLDGSEMGYIDPRTDKYVSVEDRLNRGIKAIYAHAEIAGFAALREDGSVVTWGGTRPDDSSDYKYDGWMGYRNGSYGEYVSVADKLSTGVETIFATDSSFLATKTDGSVVIWLDSSKEIEEVSRLLEKNIRLVDSSIIDVDVRSN